MPISPPAPPRLSTTNCWPRNSESLFENTRAVMSLPPPGANGTMTRTGLTGYFWASTAPGKPAAIQSDAATAILLSDFTLTPCLRDEMLLREGPDYCTTTGPVGDLSPHGGLPGVWNAVCGLRSGGAAV